MHQFHGTHNLSIVTQDVENLNSHISIKESEFVIKYLPTKKTAGLYHFPGEFYQRFKENIILILDKTFQNNQGRGHNSASSYKASINLMPQPNKDIASQENHRPIMS